MFRREWIRIVTLTLAVSFVAAACTSPEEEAQTTLKQHVIAEGIGDGETYKTTLVAADRQAFEEQEKDEKKTLPFDEQILAESLEKHIGPTYDVVVESAEVDGDTMTATADVTRPDDKQVGKILSAKFGDVGKANEGASEEEMSKELAAAMDEALADVEIETNTTQETFTLEKEGDRWLVFQNLALHNEIEDDARAARDLVRDKKFDEARKRHTELEGKADALKDQNTLDRVADLEVDILFREAMELDRKKEYEKARAAYQQIVEIDPDWKFPTATAEDAKKEIEKLDARIQEKNAVEAYRDEIEISDIEVKTRFGNSVHGELKNAGDRTLDKVELVYSFLDENGEQVHSDSRAVVFAYGDESRAMKPGHEKKFSHYASDAPDSWAGKVDVEVGEVKFFD